MLQTLLSCKPLGGIWDKAAADEIFRLRGHRPPPRTAERKIGSFYQVVELSQVAMLKRRRTAEQDVEDDAKRPHVDGDTMNFMLQNLGCDVPTFSSVSTPLSVVRPTTSVRANRLERGVGSITVRASAVCLQQSLETMCKRLPRARARTTGFQSLSSTRLYQH